jgi:hypothetical protein
MKYKQLVLQKIEQLDQAIARAITAVNHGNQEVWEDTVEKLKEQIHTLRQLVDMEND